MKLNSISRHSNQKQIYFGNIEQIQSSKPQLSNNDCITISKSEYNLTNLALGAVLFLDIILLVKSIFNNKKLPKI